MWDFPRELPQPGPVHSTQRQSWGTQGMPGAHLDELHPKAGWSAHCTRQARKPERLASKEPDFKSSRSGSSTQIPTRPREPHHPHSSFLSSSLLLTGCGGTALQDSRPQHGSTHIGPTRVGPAKGSPWPHAVLKVFTLGEVLKTATLEFFFRPILSVFLFFMTFQVLFMCGRTKLPFLLKQFPNQTQGYWAWLHIKASQ